MLKVTDLHAGYGGSEVLHSVSLRVDEGEAVVILGPNGHGKTTLAARHLRPDSAHRRDG